MSQIKSIFIDLVGEDSSIDLEEGDLIVCQKGINNHNQARGLVIEVLSDKIVIFEIKTGVWAYGDIVRIGSISNKDRQSFLVMAGEGAGAPSLSFFSDIDSFDSYDSGRGCKMIVGRLDAVKNKVFPSMNGHGVMLQNAYVEGDFVLHNSKKSIEKYIEDENSSIVNAVKIELNTIIEALPEAVTIEAVKKIIKPIVDAVNSAEGDVEVLSAGIKVLSEAIESTVKKGDVISSINQSAEKIKISANNVDIEGIVNADTIKSILIDANQLTADNINFDSMRGDDVELSGVFNMIGGRAGGLQITSEGLRTVDGRVQISADGSMLLTDKLGRRLKIHNGNLAPLPVVGSGDVVNRVEGECAICNIGGGEVLGGLSIDMYIGSISSDKRGSLTLYKSEAKVITLVKGATYCIKLPERGDNAMIKATYEDVCTVQRSIDYKQSYTVVTIESVLTGEALASFSTINCAMSGKGLEYQIGENTIRFDLARGDRSGEIIYTPQEDVSVRIKIAIKIAEVNNNSYYNYSGSVFSFANQACVLSANVNLKISKEMTISEICPQGYQFVASDKSYSRVDVSTFQ